MSIISRICFAMSLIVCTLLSNASTGQVAPRFEPLHLGEVMPGGWLQTVLERDLKSGYAGHLDELLQDPSSGDYLLRPENNDYVTRAKSRDCRHDDAGLSIPPKPRRSGYATAPAEDGIWKPDTNGHKDAPCLVHSNCTY